MLKPLIDYIPPVLRNVKELRAVYNALELEFQKLSDEIEIFKKSISPWGDPDEKYLNRQITALRINTGKDKTYDEKLFTLRAKCQEQRPFNRYKLISMLDDLVGKDSYLLDIDIRIPSVTVKLGLSAESMISDVKDLLDCVVPANAVIVTSLFNTYSLLNYSTHEQLSEYTYDRLRKDPIL